MGGKKDRENLWVLTLRSLPRWTELLAELVDRGLSGVKLIIRDEHGGLTAAARKVLPEARQLLTAVCCDRDRLTPNTVDGYYATRHWGDRFKCA